METIRQRDGKDCGVACVAMLTGTGYEQVRHIIYPSGKSRLTYTRDLYAALRELGREPLTKTRLPFRANNSANLEKDALIFVKMGKKGQGNGHWVVWDASASKVRDPGRKNPYVEKGYLQLE